MLASTRSITTGAMRHRSAGSNVTKRYTQPVSPKLSQLHCGWRLLKLKTSRTVNAQRESKRSSQTKVQIVILLMTEHCALSQQKTRNMQCANCNILWNEATKLTSFWDGSCAQTRANGHCQCRVERNNCCLGKNLRQGEGGDHSVGHLQFHSTQKEACR